MGRKHIPRERTGLILKELLKVLWAFADGLQADEVLKLVASRLKLTDHEKEEYETGGRRFDNIFLFCTIDAVKAGWMRKKDDIWTITAEGKAALQAHPEPFELSKEVSRLYQQWRSEGEYDTTACFEAAQRQALQEIRKFIDAMTPNTFKELVSALLHALGYVVAWVSPAGKEGGMAFLAWNDDHSKCPPNTKVQVRRRKENIDDQEMNAFLATINDHEVGIFLTTGGFTKEARELAVAEQRRQITLFDTRSLVDLWIKHKYKLDKYRQGLLPLRPIYFVAPNYQEEKGGQIQPTTAAVQQA